MHFTIPFVLALAATTAVALPSPRNRREVGVARSARSVLKRSSNNNTQFDDDVSGVSINATAGTFSGIAASITVPSISVPEGGALPVAMTAMISVDIATCPNTSVAAGILSVLQNNSSILTAFYMAGGVSSVEISGISLNVGDLITLNITATNATSSTVAFINQSTNETDYEVVPTGIVCGSDVDLFVQRIEDQDGLVPLANFGQLNFTDVSIETPSGSVGISDPQIFDIRQNHTVVTSVSTSPSNVLISFL